MAEDDGSALKAQRQQAARRGWRFAAALSAAIILIIAAATGLARFEFAYSGFHAPFAMALGVVFTALLGAGLMALSFYSSKAGFDDEARGMGEDDLVNRMNPSEDRSDRS